MKIYKEIKQIAKKIDQFSYLIEQLKNKGIDPGGLEWYSVEFVTLSKEDKERFKANGGETDDYFVEQTGYCEDHYHGNLYFKTDVPTQYVKVHYNC